MNNKSYQIFSGIKKNPDTNIVLSGVDDMKRFKPDLVLAIGDGFPIDKTDRTLLTLVMS